MCGFCISIKSTVCIRCMKSHNINLDGSMNIYEFIELTKSSYGENTIKKLLL